MSTWAVGEALGIKHRADHLEIDALFNDSAIDIKRDFGAVGDGSTDDSVRIQNALNVGGPIWVPPGTYIGANLNIVNDNTYLLGGGMASCIKLKNGANQPLFTNLTGVNRFFVTFDNLKIDGNKANNSSGYAIRAYMAHTWYFHRLHIVNSADAGIRFEGANVNTLALNNRVTACRIENSRNQCVFFNGFAPNNNLHHNILGGCDNFYLLEDGNAENVIVNNHFHTGANHGIYLNGATNSIVEGNYIESSNASGIYVESNSQGCRVIGNVCFNNGLTMAGDGITVVGSDCSIMGNRSFDRQGTKTQDYGIQLKAASTRNLVIGNHARSADNQTGGILDSGTGNTLASNQTT